jgi:hypothetical protein
MNAVSAMSRQDFEMAEREQSLWMARHAASEQSVCG